MSNKLIFQRKRKDLCPICLKPLKIPESGDMKHFVIEFNNHENVAIEICENHYIADAVIESSKNKFDYNWEIGKIMNKNVDNPSTGFLGEQL